MILSRKILYLITLLIPSLAVLYACNNSLEEPYLVIHEIYEVTGSEADKKPTTLRYKDVKHFDGNNNLSQQYFYEVDNTLKAYEFINKSGDKAVTNYYNKDSVLLAIYNLEYKEDRIVKRTAYDGNSKEILRSEHYSYDGEGNRTSKAIHNENGEQVAKFAMKYDEHGNEIEFSHFDITGTQTSTETYLITKSDEKNRWVERWGYKNNIPSSFHRKSYSN